MPGVRGAVSAGQRPAHVPGEGLPHGLVPLRVWVRKRRFRCVAALCPWRSFTQSCAQLPARSRLTTRLRVKVTAAVTATNRAMSDVATEHDLAWATVHRILVAAAVTAVGRAAPTSVIGIDETRARSVRWTQQQDGALSSATSVWRRSNPWMTSTVDLDLDPTHPVHAASTPWWDHRAGTGPLGCVRQGLDSVAEQRVPGRRHG